VSGKVSCHKCHGLLICDDSSLSVNGGALCIICGFVDYSFSVKKSSSPPNGLIYTVNYVGPSVSLKYKTIQAKLKRGTFNTFESICPFCEDNVWLDENTSTYIRRASVRRSTVKGYKCSLFHIFYLYMDNDENNLELGWQ